MRLLPFASAVAILAGSAAAQDAPVVPTVSGDVVSFDTWNVRYCEILLVSGPLSKLEADIYNTLGLDTCDQATFAGLDADAIAEQFGARRMFKNGPRYWVVSDLMSHTKSSPDPVVDFGGIKARKVAVVQVTEKMRTRSARYEATTVERDTRYRYAAGRPIFILTDPDGTRWVMQAYAQIVDPSLSLDDLAGLAERLKLPEGWSYQSKTLDAELIVHPVDGVARILQDDLENTYDACFETACEPQP